MQIAANLIERGLVWFILQSLDRTKAALFKADNYNAKNRAKN